MKDWFSRMRKYLGEKNQYIIQNPTTFEQKFALSIKRRNSILLLSLFILLFGFIVYLIVAFTSIKTLIPGYPSKGTELYQMDIENKQKMSRLQAENRARELWINNLRAILNETDSISMTDLKDSLTKDSSFNYKSIVFQRVPEDSILRNRLEQSQSSMPILNKLLTQSLGFKFPVKEGAKTIGLSEADEVQFVTTRKTKVSSCLAGTVIKVTENSIILQHEHNLLSEYSYLRDIAVEQGDEVKLGQQLGRTTDDNLIFHLWYKGKKVPFEFLQELNK